ncbi:MAG TPA: tRNA pseudouridine(55) synthase TruB [Beijerinckiaceae bacterium]|nr:tRNA pseudouridine(55) synthase TruB [Beijerinckiaceae bacterium]
MTDAPNMQPRPPRAEQPRQVKKIRRDVSGWIVLDKPVGMTSTHAVSIAKRLFNAKKAGHAGTLDPLASGLLPLAFGEATKTVPFVMDGEKAYRFTVKWGAETDSDDADGSVTATSERRPAQEDIENALPFFIGEISQVPPKFSALKIDGERAYDLARDGEEVVLEARTVFIRSLKLVESDADTAVFAAECGKGTYVRAIARDLGRRLGCLGHVVALRRTRVGPFHETDAITVDELRAAGEQGPESDDLRRCLLPVETALADLPEVRVGQHEATRLANGQPVILRGRDAPATLGTVYVTCHGRLVALAEAEKGQLLPKRAFHLPG